MRILLWIGLVSLACFVQSFRHSSIKTLRSTRSSTRCPAVVDIDHAEEQHQSFFFSKKSFEELGKTDSIQGALEHLNVRKPSKIQAISYNTILSGKTCIVADQTGSGKTLAYLLPVIQRMTDMVRQGELSIAPSRSPYLVVITPTTELAQQVARVCRSIATKLSFRTACVTSESDMDGEQKKLRLGSEVLVSTPGRLLALLKRDEISLDNVLTVVLDEADVLFMDQTFPLQPIGAATPESAQFVFTTATLPEIVTEQITAEFPEAEVLTGPGLHRIAPTIEEILVDCSGPAEQERSAATAFENKRLAMVRALDQSDAVRTLIFCNTINQCRNVENALKRIDRNGRVRSILPYHGALDAEKRQESIRNFIRPPLGKPAVLVCTDRASRGMDFDTASVDHIVLFDFPQEPSEYVRRVGRTGRAGRFGRATVLVHGRQVPIARRVMGASLQGKRIEPIPEMNAY